MKNKSKLIKLGDSFAITIPIQMVRENQLIKGKTYVWHLMVEAEDDEYVDQSVI